MTSSSWSGSRDADRQLRPPGLVLVVPGAGQPRDRGLRQRLERRPHLHGDRRLLGGESRRTGRARALPPARPHVRPRIGKYAVVGANAVVLPGVTLGEGCTVGALSLVNRDCEPWTIYAARPLVRSRPAAGIASSSWRPTLRRDPLRFGGAVHPHRATGDREPLARFPTLAASPRGVRGLLGDIWDRRLLSNFGKYARRVEERGAGVPLATRASDASSMATSVSCSLSRRSRSPGRERVPRPVVHLQLDRERDPLESPAAGLRGHRPEDFQRRRAGPRAPDRPSDAGHRRDPHLRQPPGSRIRAGAGERAEDPASSSTPPMAMAPPTRGVRIGDPRLGDFQVFSLSGTKQVTSAEGGLVAAASPELAARIEFRRAYGFQNDYVSRVLGLNGKLSEIHAALACLTLGGGGARRRGPKHEGGSLPRGLSSVPGLEFQEHLAGCRSAYKDFAILCPDRRDALADALEREGIQTKKYFRPLHRDALVRVAPLERRRSRGHRSPSPNGSSVFPCSTSSPTRTSTGFASAWRASTGAPETSDRRRLGTRPPPLACASPRERPR